MANEFDMGQKDLEEAVEGGGKELLLRVRELRSPWASDFTSQAPQLPLQFPQ